MNGLKKMLLKWRLPAVLAAVILGVISGALFCTEPVKAGELPERTEVRVTNAEELLSAIGSNKKIILADGIYTIQEPINLGNDCKNIEICAEHAGHAEILSKEGTAPVISGWECQDVILEGLILGHDVVTSEGCADDGYVISFYSAKNITVRSCDLYGCGIKAVDISDFRGKNTVENCVLRDCRDQAAAFYVTDNVNDQSLEFSGCAITGNTYDDSSVYNYPLIGVYYSSNNTQLVSDKVSFKDCLFCNNRNSHLMEESFDIFPGCTFHNNAFDNETVKEYGVCLNGVTWQIDSSSGKRILKIGYPLKFSDDTKISSEGTEVLPYSKYSVPWKKVSYDSFDVAEGISYDEKVFSGGNEVPGDTGAKYTKKKDTYVAGQKDPAFASKYFAGIPGITKYQSGNKKAAAVSKKGVLKAKKSSYGPVTITAMTGKGKHAFSVSSCSITILDKPKLKFQKYSAAADIGKVIDGYMAFQSESTRTTAADYWESSKPTVASVDPETGEITIRGKGTARITAYFGERGKKGTLKVKAKLKVKR